MRKFGFAPGFFRAVFFACGRRSASGAAFVLTFLRPFEDLRVEVFVLCRFGMSFFLIARFNRLKRNFSPARPLAFEAFAARENFCDVQYFCSGGGTVDAADLKSAGLAAVRVRFPFRARSLSLRKNVLQKNIEGRRNAFWQARAAGCWRFEKIFARGSARKGKIGIF